MNHKVIQTVFFCLLCMMPMFAMASVESSLLSIQSRLTGTILPIVAILGFLFAGFSYLSGNPNARSHLILSIIGAIISFGASSIVDFLKSMIQ